jgi:hypothetical protein
VTLGYVGGADEPFEYTIRTVGVWDAILRRNAGDLVKVYTAADILAAAKIRQDRDHLRIPERRDDGWGRIVRAPSSPISACA